ncbi:MAG: transposase [Bdellovibrionota bacterium]
MKQMKQLKTTNKREHGGDLSIGRRRSRRIVSVNRPMHVTLRSEFAHSGRCLLQHQKMISSVILRAASRFHISVYEKAICGNHLHLLVRGKSRVDIQNFFRVVAGHIAQNILKVYPIHPKEKSKPGGAKHARKNTCKHPKNQRKFWCALIYSRILSGWGREFSVVKNYIIKNTLEAIGVIPYQLRSNHYTSPHGAVPSG